MRIGRRLLRLVPAVALATTIGITTAGPALAHVEGPGCTATATDNNHKANPASITIDNVDVWHVSSDSNLSGEGHTDTDQTSGQASAGAFGFGVVPIASGSGHGKSGQGSLDVSQFKGVARVIYAIGSSDTCSGYLTVIVDDVSPFSTAVGIGSIVLFIIGLIGVIAVAFRRRGGVEA